MVARADHNHSWTRAFGEMVALLVTDHKPEAALHLEQLWNSLGKTHSFSLFCAYPVDSFGRNQRERISGHLHGARTRAHGGILKPIAGPA